MIRYQCQRCGVRLQTGDAMAGRAEACPSCGHRQEVRRRRVLAGGGLYVVAALAGVLVVAAAGAGLWWSVGGGPAAGSQAAEATGSEDRSDGGADGGEAVAVPRGAQRWREVLRSGGWRQWRREHMEPIAGSIPTRTVSWVRGLDGDVVRFELMENRDTRRLMVIRAEIMTPGARRPHRESLDALYGVLDRMVPDYGRIRNQALAATGMDRRYGVASVKFVVPDRWGCQIHVADNPPQHSGLTPYVRAVLVAIDE